MLDIDRYFTVVEKAIILSGGNKKGTQETLRGEMLKKGVTVAQSTISDWKKNGYITSQYADVVSEITGIPSSELTKKNSKEA